MIESLESRIAPASTLHVVNFTPAHSTLMFLLISGDPSDPGGNLSLVEIAKNEIQVHDGALVYSPPPKNVSAIIVKLGADNEQVTLNFAFGYTGTTSINLGGGNNSVTFVAGPTGSVAIVGGSGNDTITVPAGVSLGGALNVKAGDGSNLLDLRGHVAKNVSFTGGANDDTVKLQFGATIGGNFAANAGAGPNNTTLAGAITGSLKIYGGADADTVLVSETLAVGTSAKFALGAGSNVFDSTTPGSSVLGTIARNFSLTTGSGDDIVRLSGLSVTGNASVRLGAGVNSFTIPVRMFGGNQIAAFDAARLTYSGGAGADTITIASASSVIGPGTFSLGAGDDMMTYVGLLPVFSKLTVIGGGGMDSFGPQSVVAGITHKFVGIETVT